MEKLTKRDEYGNADIIGVDSADLQLNLDFDGFNKVTAALNKLAVYEDAEEQGLLVRLPQKTVYSIGWGEGKNCDNLWAVGFQQGITFAISDIASIPAADVRPVVTCGKCKYGKYTGAEWLCDKHSGHADKFGEDASYHEYHSKHWFCADGEERNHE